MLKSEQTLYFLKNGKISANDIQNANWNSHPLKKPENFPKSLKNILATIFAAQFPMLLLWENQLLQFYNDEYKRTLGGNLNVAGRPFKNHSPDVLSKILSPLAEQVFLHGNGFHFNDELIPVQDQDEYWTFTISPVYNDEEQVGGILVVFINTTDKVKNLKLMGEGQSDMEFALEATELGIWDLNPITGAFTANERLKDWFGLNSDDEIPLTLATDVILDEDKNRVNSAIKAAMHPVSGGFYDIEYTIVHPHTNVRRLVRAKGKAFFDEHGIAQRFNGTLEDITEDRRNQELFRSIIDQAPVATCLLAGKNLVIEVANDIILGYWGVDRTVIGKPVAEALPELEGQPFLQILDDVFTTGITYTDKGAPAVLVVDGKPSTYYFDFTYKALHDESGTIYGVMNMSVDVTHRVLAEKHAEEIQRQILDSFEQSPVGIATVDTENLVFRMVNPFFGKIVGREASKLTEKPMLEAIPELLGQGFDLLIHEVIATGQPFSKKEVAADILREGSLDKIYVDLTYQPRRNVVGNIIGVYIVAIDVTQQVLSRHVIEDAQIALKETVNLAKLATWQLDLNSGLFSYSDRFSKWLGLKADITSIEDFYKILSVTDREVFKGAIDSVLEPDSEGLHVAEYTLINQTNGQQRMISANAQVFYDASGNPEHISGTAQNVTKERQLQEELKFLVKQRTKELEETNQVLEISNRELQQFAYIASHDLQEPIRKISVFVEMLESSLEQINPRVESLIEKIKSSSTRMTNLIKDILSISQLSHALPNFEKTDLNQIATEIIHDFELAIEQKSAVILLSGLPVIDAIPLQMSQLFGNLISNSLKYSRADTPPEITITAAILNEVDAQKYDLSEKKYYKIEFRDNGIGFDAQYADKIFEIFQRLHGKNEFIGTGIGLAICKKIVQNHNGIIKAESSGMRGALFTILLPIREI